MIRWDERRCDKVREGDMSWKGRIEETINQCAVKHM